MYALRKLEIHAAHSCNLTCESCSHYSNHRIGGVLSLETAEEWLTPWSLRLRPDIFALVGGEPSLNPRLADLVELSARLFPNSTIEVASNGFFLHKHPRLLAALKQRGRLVLSCHSEDMEYKATFGQAVALARRWEEEGLELEIRHSNAWWTRRYDGYGPTMRPVQGAGNPKLAYMACSVKTCRQIHLGHLWKCPTVAYIGQVVERWPGVAEHFLEATCHLGLPPGATDEQLQRYLNQQEDPACSNCPPYPQRFTPASPLIPAAQLLREARASR